MTQQTSGGSWFLQSNSNSYEQENLTSVKTNYSFSNS